MFFRPTFCAHCGERIERAQWLLWTSRRFCQVCETTFKGQDLILRAFALIVLCFSLFGLSRFFSSRPVDSGIQTAKQVRKMVEQPIVAAKDVRERQPAETVNNEVIAQQPAATLSSQTEPRPLTAVKPKVEVAEPIYYCGAETKKGTPCSRRVKRNMRCFQHTGMPVLALNEKSNVK